MTVRTSETQAGISPTEAEKFLKDSWANMVELNRVVDHDSPWVLY